MTFFIASYTAPLPAPSEKQSASAMLMLDLDLRLPPHGCGPEFGISIWKPKDLHLRKEVSLVMKCPPNLQDLEGPSFGLGSAAVLATLLLKFQLGR